MSVVTSLTAVPNRIAIVWNYLITDRKAGIKEDELARLLTLSSLRRQAIDDGAGAMAAQVLSEMRALKLIERDSEGRVTMAKTAPQTKESFLEYLEQHLLDADRAEAVCGRRPEAAPRREP